MILQPKVFESLLIQCVLALVFAIATIGSSVRASDVNDLLNSASYQPITSEQWNQHQERFIASLDALETVLADNPHGSSWRQYLMLDGLRAIVSTTPSDIDSWNTVVDRVSAGFYRMTGLHDGLARPEFIRYRSALQTFRKSLLSMARDFKEQERLRQWREDLEAFPDEVELKNQKPTTTAEQFVSQLSQLADSIRSAETSGSSRSVRQIESISRWLAVRDQVPELLAWLSAHYARPNVDVDISERALVDMTVRPVTEIESISRWEDGVRIQGQAVVRGTAAVHPIMGHDSGQCEVRFVGTVTTTLHGRQGPVSFGLTGLTNLTAQKPVTLRADEIRGFRSVAQASTNLRTDRVCSKFQGAIGRLVRRIATNEIAKQRPQARRDLSHEAADSFLERFDEDIAEELLEAQDDLDNELHLSLRKLDLTPERFDFASNPQRLNVQLQFGNAVLKPYDVNPLSNRTHDCQVHLHESTINGVCNRLFAGKEIRSLREEIQLLGIDLDAGTVEKLPENIGLRFAVDNPITVAFSKDAVSIEICIDSGKVNDVNLAGMNIAFQYRLHSTKEGLRLVLGDEIAVTPVQGRTSGQFVAQKNVLVKRLHDELPPEIALDPIAVDELPETLDRLGNLEIDQFMLSEGWLHAALIGDRAPKQAASSP